MISLATELETFSHQFQEKCAPRKSTLMRQAQAKLADDLTRRPLLQPGQQAPDFSVLSTTGEVVVLSEKLARGPVILSFYRGGWCPYCMLELRAYQRLIKQLEAHRITLLALSPQTLEKARNDVERNVLSFTVATDSGAKVAQAYHIDYQLDGALKQLYTEIGHPLPDYNGDNNWQLPIPATFVIAPEGHIVMSYINPDHHKRLEPSEAIAAAIGHP